MDSRKKVEVAVVMGLACFFGLLFWVVDSYFEFKFFHENLSFLLLEGPENYLESLVLKVPLHSLFVRSSVFAAALVGGALTAMFLVKKAKSDEALRFSEEKFRNLFSNAEIAMFRSTLDGSEVLDANQKFLDLIGKTREETVGHAATILWENPQERQKMVEMLKAGGSVSEFEFRMLHSEKGVRDCITSLRLYREQGILEGSISDITERRKAEEERVRLQHQLIQAQKMESVGQLAGGVAHDFNNMLGVILGHAEMAMVRLAPNHAVFADLTEIKKAAERSADITRQLLAFARKQTIAPKVIDLNDTIGKLLKMLRRLIGEDIDLAWVPGFGLWEVKADPVQIDQILTNICVNARGAIAGVGRITVETGNSVFDAAFCALHRDCCAGEYVRIAVTDTGRGMDKLTMAHIFEPFFTTKGVGEGTGLGLAMVYGAVKQNNGFIDVVSEPGQGTTFTIYLPRYRAAVPASQTGQDRGPAPAAGGQEIILLVEDEPTILHMTAAMLQMLGYTALVAARPQEALNIAKARQGEIHLLLTDIVMPEMNGRELAQKLLPIYPQLKCLFMSGYTSDIIAQQGILDEGVHFIQKPFAKNDLAAKIRILLEKK